MSSRQDGTRLRSRDSIYKTKHGTRIAIEKWRQSPRKRTGATRGRVQATPKLPRGNCLGTRLSGREAGRKLDENRKERLSPSRVPSAIQPEPTRYRGDCLGDRSDVQCIGQRGGGGKRRGEKNPRTCSESGSRAVTRDTRNLLAISGVSVLWPSRETSRMHRLFLVVIEEL